MNEGKKQIRVVRVIIAALVGSLLLLVPIYVGLDRRAKFVDYWIWTYPDGDELAAPALTASERKFADQLVKAAIERTQQSVRYDPAYVSIPYPGGDVPSDTGVCSDVIIRSYRALGVDLQRKVHEDMSEHFFHYPPLWALLKPDSNIDHRRVPNLMVFFKRHGRMLPISDQASDYQPGEIIAWQLGGGVTHIGILTDQKSASGNYQVVHNIGGGPCLEDMLYEFRIIGRFRYFEVNNQPN